MVVPPPTTQITGEINIPQLLLDEIRDLRKEFDGLKEEVTKARVDIGGLKVKSGIWGTIGGMIPTSIMFVWVIAREKLKAVGI